MFVQPHFYNNFSPKGGGYFANERVQKIHHLPVFLYHETKLWDRREKVRSIYVNEFRNEA